MYVYIYMCVCVYIDTNTHTDTHTHTHTHTINLLRKSFIKLLNCSCEKNCLGKFVYLFFY